LAAKVKFEFKEASQFRAVYIDGAFGGPTPSGVLYMSLFADRNPMPDKVVYSVEGNSLGPEIMEERSTSDAITRIQEVGVIMSFETAAVLRDWLSRQIDEQKKRLAPIAPVDSVTAETKH
jgi:hypothetical protein